ncbi:MAG: hypothetical protein ACTS5V_09575, partial [Giesbergeria sp.]
MDAIRLPPSQNPQGAHATRQKPTGGTAPDPGAFFALLTGLQDTLVGQVDPVRFDGSLAEDSNSSAVLDQDAVAKDA